MPTHTDQNYSLQPKDGGGVHFETKNGDSYGNKWTDVQGWVKTPHGFVRAISYTFKTTNMSYLELIKNGRSHTRRFDKAYTARGLVTKARQFANDINKRKRKAA